MCAILLVAWWPAHVPRPKTIHTPELSLSTGLPLNFNLTFLVTRASISVMRTQPQGPVRVIGFGY